MKVASLRNECCLNHQSFHNHSLILVPLCSFLSTMCTYTSVTILPSHPPPEGCVPLDPPLCLQGPVVRGFGRGSRELGIKTANLDADALAGSLADAVTGIFAGWARIGDDPTVYKTALSIGYNPHFANKVLFLAPLDMWCTTCWARGMEMLCACLLAPCATGENGRAMDTARLWGPAVLRRAPQGLGVRIYSTRDGVYVVAGTD